MKSYAHCPDGGDTSRWSSAGLLSPLSPIPRVDTPTHWHWCGIYPHIWDSVDTTEPRCLSSFQPNPRRWTGCQRERERERENPNPRNHESDGQPNFDNRTLWIDDNIKVLRGINDEVIDLIYLDPPFNSKRIYNAPLGSSAAEASFDDTWKMDSVKQEWAELQETADRALWHVIEGAALTAGEAMQSYLIFMAARLAEMHRVLKTDGSILLHCDPHASHYLKQLLDWQFGTANFRNEVVWKRTSTKSLGAKRFTRDGDRILYYSKSAKFTWNQQYRPHDPEYVRKNYSYDDGDGLGPYQTQPLTGGKPGGPLAYKPFKGVEPSKGRAWSPPRRDKFPPVAAARLPQDYEELDILSRCAALDDAGLLHWSKTKNPRYKSYLSIKHGNPASDIITHVPPVTSSSAERTGWPTQKPLALLRLLIRAASNEGDWVLDPFAGCATTCVAAEIEGRQWAGIDIDEVAVGVTLKRLQDHADAASHNVNLSGLWSGLPTVNVPPGPPKRTDPDRPKRTPNSKLRLILWADLPKSEDDEDRGLCPGCGKAKYAEDFDLDHIIPRAKNGPDTDSNRQLLCGNCNRIKGSRLTMTELRETLGQTA